MDLVNTLIEEVEDFNLARGGAILAEGNKVGELFVCDGGRGLGVGVETDACNAVFEGSTLLRTTLDFVRVRMSIAAAPGRAVL